MGELHAAIARMGGEPYPGRTAQSVRDTRTLFCLCDWRSEVFRVLAPGGASL